MHLLFKNNDDYMIVPKVFRDITKMKGWELIGEVQIEKEIVLDKLTKVIVTNENKYIIVKTKPDQTFFFDTFEELKGALKLLKKESFIDSF